MSGNNSLIISERLQAIVSTIPEGIELVAVSKFQPVESIRAAYLAGQRIFGESRVNELLEKIPRLPEDIRWHFIGHLQTNKVKQLVGNVSLLESVDSIRLLELIDKESRSKGVVTNVLLQVHVALEETKFGFLKEEILEYIDSKEYQTLGNTNICGIMAMASNTEDTERVRADFAEASSIFREISERAGNDLKDFKQLSMGMSGDWPIAVEEGATIIRIGSAIFGERSN